MTATMGQPDPRFGVFEDDPDAFKLIKEFVTTDQHADGNSPPEEFVEACAQISARSNCGLPAPISAGGS
jgi:hypothetical protein